VGDDGLFMVGSHIGHDSDVGHHVVLTNHVSLGGHTSVGDHVMMGAASGLHQFARIGRHAVVGAGTPVRRDVVPFALCTGDAARIEGLNLVGLRRRGFENGRIRALQEALDRLFAKGGTRAERLDAIEADFADHAEVVELVAFARSPSKRGLAQP
jgi:UDP-N-acetylglucosamine acyltransferase